MTIIKTVPVLKDYLWGGKTLKEYHKISLGKIAESWEFSLHPDGLCKTSQGKTLYGMLEKENFAPLGPVEIKNTPIIKFLNSAQPLSVQIHPQPEKGGKNELWVILETEPESFIYLGTDSLPKNFKPLCKNGEILQHLRKISVSPGENYFIPAGTIHALGPGITALEIQQFSNLTYRIYDYNRTDKDGNARPLHFKEAETCLKEPNSGKQERFFQVERKKIKEKEIFAPQKTFFTLTILQGQGQIETIPAKKGDTFFIPCETPASVEGNLDMIAVQPEPG